MGDKPPSKKKFWFASVFWRLFFIFQLLFLIICGSIKKALIFLHFGRFCDIKPPF